MVIHIVPSGSSKTLCGLKGRKGTSIGLASDCWKCLEVAEIMTEAELKSNSEKSSKSNTN